MSSLASLKSHWSSCGKTGKKLNTTPVPLGTKEGAFCTYLANKTNRAYARLEVYARLPGVKPQNIPDWRLSREHTHTQIHTHTHTHNNTQEYQVPWQEMHWAIVQLKIWRLPIFFCLCLKQLPPNNCYFYMHAAQYSWLPALLSMRLCNMSVFTTGITYHQLKARRALLLFNNVPLRTKNMLLVYKAYGHSALLVLKRILLNSII